MQRNQHQVKATLVGFSAVLMWSTLALLTKLSGAVPPFQLTAMCFTIAFLISSLLLFKRRSEFLHHFKLPISVWLTGVIGLCGYHFFYFIALQNAPTVEASLIAYLWPLLIVLFSALLPNEKLRWFHLLGALVSFIGAGFLITGGKSLLFNPQHSLGYLSAFICALTWSSYSLLSRQFGAIPTNAVGGFCGVTAILAWLCHGLFEKTVLPVAEQWLAVICLGLGPVGLAFFTWDYGVKHGNIKVLGTLSYAAPLLSTGWLMACGLAKASWIVGVSCLLIIGGAMIAAGDFFKKTA